LHAFSELLLFLGLELRGELSGEVEVKLDGLVTLFGEKPCFLSELNVKVVRKPHVFGDRQRLFEVHLKLHQVGSEVGVGPP